jgi:hypothetical protein
MTFGRALIGSLLLLGPPLAERPAAAQPAPSDETASLAAMRALADATDVRLGDDNEEASAKLLAQPILRYSDAVRGIRDASLWAWTVEGVPVAFQKIEDYRDPVAGALAWTYCLTTASPRPVHVAWNGLSEYASAALPERFLTLADGPAPAASAPARARQLRTLARQFSGTIYLDATGEAHETLRLLPRPLLEYAAAERDVLAGAVFGMAFGTNPDLLLLVELRGPSAEQAAWRVAPARMTTGGLSLKYGDAEVWSDTFVEPQPRAFEAWTFFFVPQEER